MAFSTRKITRSYKIHNLQIGPLTVTKTLNNVLAEIKPALFSSRILVAYITKPRIYTRPRDKGRGNVPDSLDDLFKVIDEEVEDV